MTPTQNKSPLIHAARIRDSHGHKLLFLRRLEPYRFIWFCETSPANEVETSVWGGTSEEALLAAYQLWKYDEFKPLHCGFRYTLPERDEVGTNALFCQMSASYQSMTGAYFDEEVGANCIVYLASQEARQLLKRLKEAGEV